MKTKTIKRLLIANRGEIACRIIRTAKSLGITTIAIYSDADALALHVQMADESIAIGASPASESYLNIDVVVQAAVDVKADAVHPGYGFLSENEEFARRLNTSHIIFVGPPPEAIGLMGDKRQAKLAMQSAGVPTLPGYSGSEQDDAALLQAAHDVGFPLMVKASAGGGGRGMRLVYGEDDLHAAITSARSEALNAFGNGELLLERALIKPRHIEIQIFSDQQGNCVYIGDRDCSIQRRHQKVVEEAPAPNLTAQTRIAMGEAAVAVAKSCHYQGAGTVEFLLDSNGDFYFLEMNTRLQVEHPVTEAVFKLDLVSWQLTVAAGGVLPKLQHELAPMGHAIEVRLYAEDPAQNFLPQTGTVLHWQSATDLFARVDHMLFDGAIIGNWYDPMLAKIIVWGETREQAIRRLLAQIEHTVLLGVNHNLGFLASIVNCDAFHQAQLHTSFLAENHLLSAQHAVQGDALLAAQLLRFLHNKPQTNHNWYKQLSSLSQPAHQTWHIDDQSVQCLFDTRTWKQDTLSISTDTEHLISHIKFNAHHLGFRANGRHIQGYFAIKGDEIALQIQGYCLLAKWKDPLLNNQAQRNPGDCLAPMDGLVVALLVTEGAEVSAGQTLLIMEAMKMEMPIKAQRSGTVTLHCQKGDQVKHKAELASVRVDKKERHDAR